MKERPILFSGTMIRAILDGRKTQTRRILKSQPPSGALCVAVFHHPDPRTHFWANDRSGLLDWAQACPYGEVGDRLYVRETWQHSNHPFGAYENDCLIFYRADYLHDPLGPDLERSADGIRREWRPSIHMPRAASRITLEVTGVRVERLQEISEEDAIAEGLIVPMYEQDGSGPTYQCAYRHLWDDLNTARGYGWDANPWVWVVEFRRIES